MLRASLRWIFLLTPLLSLCLACARPAQRSAPVVSPARSPSVSVAEVSAPSEQKPEPKPLPATAEVLPPANRAAKPVRDEKVERLLSSLTLEQKIGQLMMVGFAGTGIDDEVEALVKGRQVGGVCMFKRNIESAEQIAHLNDDLRRLFDDAIPPFIALDQEGGNVVRIRDGNVVLPGNMALGATHSPRLAYEAGRAQAEDLMLLGFNMNLAPVLDVNVNPKNPVIGIRSFGDRPEMVAEFGAKFVRGQQDANIITIAKHFPGHGNTDADSHRALPVMPESREELMAQLVPFTRVISEGLDGLMTAHVAIPKVTGHPHPATLAPEILTGLLRKEFAFGGLVITDELEMEAIAEHYGVGRAAVMSVNAGADMVLIPWRPEKKTEVYDALLTAARSGEISRTRIDEAVRNILAVKVRRGLFEAPRPAAERLAELGRHERQSVVREIARQSVTLLRTDPKHLPLRKGQRIGVLTAEAALGEAIRARAPGAQVVVVPAYPSSQARTRLRARARELALQSDVVIVGLINSRQVDLVLMAAATGKPVVVVSMGLPYLVEQVDEARAVLAVYSYQDSSTEAAAAALFGEQQTSGRLPVTLSKRHQYGFGLDPGGRPLNTETASSGSSSSAGMQ